MSDAAVSYLAYSLVALFFVTMVTMEILVRRAVKRTDNWAQKFRHRKVLEAASRGGEESLEFHAMQCTRCGGFHPEDDEDCPNFLVEVQP